MKQSKNHTLNQFIIPILFISLFFSCDLDKSKLTLGNDTTNAENTTPESAEIGVVDISLCGAEIEGHHGCTCDFKDGSGSTMFLSNMDQAKSACISINGKTEMVTGERIDSRQEHLKHSHIPDWIVLDPNGEVHLFNELVDDASYEENKDLIVQTMLVMHVLPEELKIRINQGANGEKVAEDLASRYEQMWSEAFTEATEERASGNHGTHIEIHLSNETFDVFVKGDVEKHNEDGSDNYKGKIEIKSKSGKVLGNKDFVGICICD